MEEKELELEFDVGHIKNAINRFATIVDNTKAKMKSADRTYNSRKSFILSQFANMFSRGRWH